MLARRQFRHDTAVFRMELNLRRDRISQHPAMLDHRYAGLIARSLDGKEHPKRSSLDRPGGLFGRGEPFGPSHLLF